MCAFVAIPFALFLGRPHGVGDPPRLEWSGWTILVVLGLVVTGIGLLVASAIAGLEDPR